MLHEGKLLKSFIKNHTAQALVVIEKQPDDIIAALMSGMPFQLSSKLLVQLDGFRAVEVLKHMKDHLSSKLLEEIPLSTAASILRLLDEEQQQHLLSGVSQETSRDILRLLNYPKHTAGSHVDSAVFTLNQTLSAEIGLERIKLHQRPVDNQIFVLDHYHKLVGCIGLKELLTADPQKEIRLLMETNAPSILADTRVTENLIENLNWDAPPYRIPVVDSDGLFLGVVSKKDLTPEDKASRRQASQASVALAELYQIGLTSLFRSTD
jgi:magnesium transporter